MAEVRMNWGDRMGFVGGVGISQNVRVARRSTNDRRRMRSVRKRSALSMTAISEATFSRSADVSARVYDYVIVGAGAAGCVLANRLSENGKKSVLVLEAGKTDDKMYIHIPLGFPYLCGSDIDWKYQSLPDEQVNNRRLYFPRGKVVGGSHAISVMMYQRGSPRDYELWEDEFGADGWGPKDVLPYFKKSEDYEHGQSTFHGVGGPLRVSDLRTVNPMAKTFLEACNSMGLQKNEDFNDWGHDQEGYGTFQVTQRDGQRETPSTAYLRSALNRRNVSLETNVIVEKVQIEATDNKHMVATGVHLINKDGYKEFIRAKEEVLLAGGVFASPQLLMLSGVGPAEHLKSHGIDVKVNLPGVGKNLQDHVSVLASYSSKDPMNDKKANRVYYSEQTGKDLRNLAQYFLTGSGPLTSNMCEAGGFFRTREEEDLPDLQIRFVPFYSEPDPYFSMGDFATAGNYLTNKANRPAGFTVQSIVARPKSIGSVELANADVRSPVSITANWLSDDRDLQTLVSGLRMIRDIVKKPEFDTYRGAEAYPGDSVTSDEDLVEYVKESCHTANALVGTCRMGRLSDPMSVVDTKLRVKGIDNLRVIDSSVMPTLPGAQCGAPTMMIAERGADMIMDE